MQPLQRQLSKGALTLFFVLAAIGFIDAGYLTVEHYINAVPPCSIGSCETVLTSQYSEVLGLPVSLLGALYYFAVLVLLMVYLDSKKAGALTLSYWIIALGAVVSLILILIQAFVIHAYCLYCMTSDVLSIIFFIVFTYVWRSHQKALVTPMNP